MNFAMICDCVGGGMKSHYIKDNKGYDFNGNPFEFNVKLFTSTAITKGIDL